MIGCIAMLMIVAGPGLVVLGLGMLFGPGAAIIALGVNLIICALALAAHEKKAGRL